MQRVVGGPVYSESGCPAGLVCIPEYNPIRDRDRLKKDQRDCPVGTLYSRKLNMCISTCPEGDYCILGEASLPTQGCPPGLVCIPEYNQREPDRLKKDQRDCPVGTLYSPKLNMCISTCPEGDYCILGEAVSGLSLNKAYIVAGAVALLLFFGKK